jgi:hypothetical protein
MWGPMAAKNVDTNELTVVLCIRKVITWNSKKRRKPW